MHLQFTVRLVELQLFRPAGAPEYPVLVVPRVTARTQEITRAIVRLQPHVDPADVEIEGVPDRQTSPGLEGFVEDLLKVSPAAEDFATFIAEVAPLGVLPDPTTDGVSLRYPDPAGTSQEFRILRARRNGRVRIGLLRKQLENRGYSVEPALKYNRTIAGWVPGARVNGTGSLVDVNNKRLELPLAFLMRERRPEYSALVRELLDDIRRVAANSSVAN